MIRSLRVGVAVSLVGTVLSVATPAAAKAPAARISLHSTAASFHIGAAVLVTGTVTPKASTAVEVERLEAKKWVAIAHAKPTAAGTFTVSVKAGGSAATWSLRAVRAKSGAVKALISPTISVHVVKPIFVISATTAASVIQGGHIVVTGKVSPRATGTVLLQTTKGAAWYSFASAKLTKTSTFTLTGTLPLGKHALRVIKAATTTVAGGVSKTVSATVTLPPLTVGTTVLPDATAEVAYAVQLSAAGGLAPYTWSVAGLPAGLTVSPTGLLSGKVPSVGAFTLTVTVTDARLAAVSEVLPLHAYLSSHAANLAYAWGYGGDGELGDDQTAQLTQPVPIGLTGLTRVAGAMASAVGVRFGGDVWTWGLNDAGQLGISTTTANSLVPVQVPGLSGITSVAAAESTIYALGADGAVWAWGAGGAGQRGDGTTSASQSTPAKIPGLSGVVAIAAGELSGYALKSDGTVWGWGFNGYGALGDGTTINRSSPVQVQGLSGVTAISAGASELLAVRSDGTAWAVGNNDSGQLGDGTVVERHLPVQVTGLSHVVQIAAGGTDSYAMTSDGAAWGWGNNSAGQVGDGTMTDRHSPTQLALTGVVEISAGGQTGFARLADGTALGWGYAGNGQVGVGSLGTHVTPAPLPALTHVLQITGGSFDSYAVTGS